MQAATVGAVLSGDSGWACSRIAAACAVSPSLMAAMAACRVAAASSGVPDRCEQGHVLPLDCAGHCRLQGFQVRRAVGVVEVDTFLGQQRRDLAQHLVGHSGPVLDPRRPGWGFRIVPVHVGHGCHLGSSLAEILRVVSGVVVVVQVRSARRRAPSGQQLSGRV
ncbi:MAG: hypothetical protein GEV09_25670, partial [Pseudonocardiaceae bacterium]|nr:hypothetical protein [Pseudonocardiaceae bacterium]